jgi:ubiquinone/menaquinone biosynthesis C-methylase UbiE
MNQVEIGRGTEVPARGVATTPVHCVADVRAFFDRSADHYCEQHGPAEALLQYRLDLVRAHARLGRRDVVLDVGCGNGHHLLALAGEIAAGIGVDLSHGMIRAARARLASCPWPERVTFALDDAARLARVANGSIDLVTCIGALEHMLDKPAVLASMYRVLRPGGRLFCLTPDGDYLWYRSLAPRLGYSTKHLSTDHFLTRAELSSMLVGAGFSEKDVEFGAWSFVPRGDIPSPLGWALGALDAVGRRAGITALRGGLWVCAWKR